MNKLIRYHIVVPEEAVERLSGLLALHVPFGWEEESRLTGETCFCVHCGARDFMDTLAEEVRRLVPEADLQQSLVDDEDWTKAWREFFTPIACGTRFLVLPPWLRHNTDLQGRTAIVIEPKSAFGTGHHATTALCLGVISDLLDAGKLRSGMEFLDLGTGSGILGIGCCLSGLYGIGTDIDPLAVDNALENREINGIPPLRRAQAQGLDIVRGSMEVVADRSFDLVLANILAQPLKDMAADLVKAVAAGGCLVLSGLLIVQADGVEAAYRAQGLPAPRRVTEGEWAALVWD